MVDPATAAAGLKAVHACLQTSWQGVMLVQPKYEAGSLRSKKKRLMLPAWMVPPWWPPPGRLGRCRD